MTKDCHLIRNRENRYLQDRDEMKTSSYSGLGRHIPVQDIAIVELAGDIQDRTEEQLGYSDKVITILRRALLVGLRDLGIDQELPTPVVLSETFPASQDWKTFASKRIEEEEARVAQMRAGNNYES